MHTNLNSSEPIWAAEINHKICQTSLDELKSWVLSGRLKPTDKVRMKNLNWIEAQKIPAFSKLFEAIKDQNISLNSVPPPNPISPVNSVPALIPNSFGTSLEDGTVVQTGSKNPLNFEKSETEFSTLGETTPITGSLPYDFEKEIKPFLPVGSIEQNFITADENHEKQTIANPLPGPPRSKERVALIETPVLCPTCFYFCRYIPRTVDGLPFSCPACNSDCISIEPADGKIVETSVFDGKKTNIPFPDLADGVIPKLQKKNKVLGFVFGCLLISGLAVGGSYLWVYQLRAPVENDEQTNQELVVLQEKFTTDKIGVSLKFASLEQSPKQTDSQGNIVPKADISQELASLQKQYEFDRKNITDNFQNKKAQSDFQQISVISFIALLVLYILKKLLLG